MALSPRSVRELSSSSITAPFARVSAVRSTTILNSALLTYWHNAYVAFCYFFAV